jgi:mRNA interferase RelE/StbE
MREVLYHRAASRALKKIPLERKEQIKAAIAMVAEQSNVLLHPSVKIMQGEWVNCMRLRVGTYRVIFRITGHPSAERLEVLEAGPRSDIYESALKSP